MNEQVQNIVHRFATLQLSLPITPTTQQSITLEQCVATFCTLMVITSIGNLQLLDIPQTSHSFGYIFPANNHSGNIVGQGQNF
jgi:hypothetical protein